jgi:fatty-acyl-CoA synthase
VILTTSHWPADTSDEILPTTVGGVLREAAATAPERTALVAGVPDPSDRRRWTYAELLEEAEKTAQALLARFEPGEHIAVWAPNVPEWVLLQYGAALAGLVLVTVNPAYRPAELEYVLRQSRAAGVFLLPQYRSNAMAEALESIRPELPDLRDHVLLTDWEEFLDSAGPGGKDLPEVGSEKVAALLYTSGTTGFPKGALLTHGGITNNARLVAQRWDQSAGGINVNPMPLFHVGGCVLASVGTIATLGTYVPLLAFDPALMLELVETEKATIMSGVPTMLIAIMEHPDLATRDISSVRVVGSGGSQVPAELVRRIEAALGVRFGIVFGQTECSAVVTQTFLDDGDQDKAETIGRPLPQVEVKVIDPVTDEVVAPGALGELCVRGFLVMSGYFEMPEATAATVDADGWLHTGDLGTMDERGYCRIEGRLRDMIIRGGENIYPREIEAALFEHPAVADVAVAGIPDDRWGEQVAAFVRLGAGRSATPEELSAHVRLTLAAYKVPSAWIFVDAFPLTGSGKVQKFALRESFVKGELTAVTGMRGDA